MNKTDSSSSAACGFANRSRCIGKAAGGGQKPSGFTLIECLFALFLIAMVLPTVNLGIGAATRQASQARHRAEAAGLAQSTMSSLITSEQWANGGILSGDYGAEWKDYHWTATVSNWANDTQNVGLQQLDVTVIWPATGPQDSLTISSLVYVRP